MRNILYGLLLKDTVVTPKIVVHCQVKNEELWVWFAVMSVLDYVDEVLIWDTGSTDNTVEVIKTINNSKVKFKQVENTADETALSRARTQMIEASKGFDWMMILDGDEVWPRKSIKMVTEFIRLHGRDYDSIVTPTLNCVGDVFHVSPPSAGHYSLAGRVGHLNTRFINLGITGLHVSNLPGKLQGYYDHKNTAVHDLPQDRMMYLDCAYLHMTHMPRSRNRENETNVFWRGAKRKYELGLRLPEDFEYPPAFYLPRPTQVASPWGTRSFEYLAIALFQAPLKLIKRTLHHGHN